LFAGADDGDDDEDDVEYNLDEIPEIGDVEESEVSADGNCAVRFNQPMYIKELFDKFNIGLAAPVESISKNFVDSTADERRLQGTDS